jgi:hypothetical protein
MRQLRMPSPQGESHSQQKRAKCFRLKTSHVFFLFRPSSFVTRLRIRWNTSSRAYSRCVRCLNPLSPSPSRDHVCVHSPLLCCIHGGGCTFIAFSKRRISATFVPHGVLVLVSGCVNSQAAPHSNSLGDLHHTRSEIRAIRDLRFNLLDCAAADTTEARRHQSQSVTLCRLPSNPYSTPKNLASSITPPKYLLWLEVRRRLAVCSDGRQAGTYS